MPSSPFVSIVEKYAQQHFVINNIAKSTQTQYKSYINLIRKFFTSTPVNSIASYHADDLFVWLRNRPCTPSRCTTAVLICKNALDFARKRGMIKENPFQDFKPVYSKIREISFPKENELEKIINEASENVLEERVKDIYSFIMFSGLSYSDLDNFKIITIKIKCDNGEEKDIEVIYGKRKKSGVEFWIPLLPEAKRILEKYNYNLPKIKYRTYWGVYKKLFASVSVKHKPHDARKIFANNMFEKNKLSIEAIRIMLGHTNSLTTSRHYIVTANFGRLQRELSFAGMI